MSGRSAGHGYGSFPEFYLYVYDHAVTELRPAGRTGASMIHAGAERVSRVGGPGEVGMGSGR